MIRTGFTPIGIFAASLATAGLTACGTTPADPGPLQSLPRDLTASESELVQSGNAFGLALFRELAAERDGENVIASPLSAYMALGMTLNGADGTTLEEMKQVLHLSDLTEEAANESFLSLITLLRGLDSYVDFEIANSVWYRTGFPASQEFVDSSGQYFDAVVNALDFADPSAPGTINGWVEEQTNGKITELIGQIDPMDVMFLINAIYFKGDWERPFDRDRTRTEHFTLSDGALVDVPMMQGDGDFLHLETELFQGVDLRYGRSAFSMTVLVPNPGHDLDDLIAALDAETWGTWVEAFAEHRIMLGLPRFRLEWEETLNNPLQAMGMVDAFDPGRANFSRLVEQGAVLPGNLYVTEVKQKTFIDVNEEGTEAAAATSVGVGVTSLPPMVRADRPFLFAIRERFSGTVLFIGAVENPIADGE
jgi:serpin B